MLRPEISRPRRAGTATGLGVKSSAPARPHRQSSVGGWPPHSWPIARRKVAMRQVRYIPREEGAHAPFTFLTPVAVCPLYHPRLRKRPNGIWGSKVLWGALLFRKLPGSLKPQPLEQLLHLNHRRILGVFLTCHDSKGTDHKVMILFRQQAHLSSPGCHGVLPQLAV